ncbi:hypothetical protein ANO11243_055910 [Dothideomycetidae sp. 11243]|nr:hypothetical protein ANO11243_055910 [fungal sp. No.11243]
MPDDALTLTEIRGYRWSMWACGYVGMQEARHAPERQKTVLLWPNHVSCEPFSAGIRPPLDPLGKTGLALGTSKGLASETNCTSTTFSPSALWPLALELGACDGKGLARS